MDVVVYSETNEQQVEVLLSQIRRDVKIEPDTVRSFEALFTFLESRVSSNVIIVFMIYSEDELDTLLFSKPRLFNIKYIIVLLEDQETLVTRALAMQPRFLSFIAENYTAVCTVLLKMINKKDPL